MPNNQDNVIDLNDNLNNSNISDEDLDSSDLDNSNIDKNKTHFGYQTVDSKQKAGLVANVFHSVAARYDVMNDLMSLGIHRLWKRYTIELSAARPGHRILDLAGGTGDLAKKFSRIVGSDGLVVLSDINESMLSIGRDQLIDQGCIANTQTVQADAQYLPFPDDYFDCITISFGLRNVTDKAKALRSMYRVTKPGGKIMVLEFSKPTDARLEKIYDEYSFRILPKIGKYVAQDEDSYRYLAESIRMHPDQETLKNMALEAGFSDCKYYNLTGGIVALHIASKSA